MYTLVIVKRNGEVRSSYDCGLKSVLKMQMFKEMRKTDKAVIFEGKTPLSVFELNESGVPTDVSDKYQVEAVV